MGTCPDSRYCFVDFPRNLLFGCGGVALGTWTRATPYLEPRRTIFTPPGKNGIAEGGAEMLHLWWQDLPFREGLGK